MQLQDKARDNLPVEDEEPEEVARLGPSHGIWIALATFVPTFLAIFFGIPYLAGLPITSRSPVDLQGSLPPVVPSLGARAGLRRGPAARPGADDAPGDAHHAGGGTGRRAGAVAINADERGRGKRRSPGDHPGNPSICVATDAASGQAQGSRTQTIRVDRHEG